MKNRIIKYKFYIVIFIFLMTLSMAPFFSTNATFKDVEIQPAGIQIKTGKFDIALKDNSTGSIGTLSYSENINQSNITITKSNLSVENLGTLTNNLSAKSSVTGQSDIAGKIRIELVNINGESRDISGDSYISLNGFINSGDKFALKISYKGLLPTKATTINAEISFRGTQPNDQQNAPTMFTDVEKIKYTINVAAQNINSDFEFASINGNFKYSLKEFAMYYGYAGDEFVPYNYGKIKVLIPTNIDHNKLEINFYYSTPKYVKRDFDPSTRVLTLYFEPNGITSREYSFMKYTGQVAINVIKDGSVVISDQIGFWNNATSGAAYAYEIGFTTDKFTTLQYNGMSVAKLTSSNIQALGKQTITSSLGYIKYENNAFSITSLPDQLYPVIRELTFSNDEYIYTNGSYPFQIVGKSNGNGKRSVGTFKIKSLISDKYIYLTREVVDQ